MALKVEVIIMIMVLVWYQVLLDLLINQILHIRQVTLSHFVAFLRTARLAMTSSQWTMIIPVRTASASSMTSLCSQNNVRPCIANGLTRRFNRPAICWSIEPSSKPMLAANHRFISAVCVAHNARFVRLGVCFQFRHCWDDFCGSCQLVCPRRLPTRNLKMYPAYPLLLA